MTLLFTAAMLSSLLTSCIFDPKDDPCEDCDGDTSQTYLPVPLESRTGVLNNLEVAYNRRHLNKYMEVLDTGFTFFFYSGDVGGEIPAQWDRESEEQSNKNLFDVNYDDTDPSDGIQPPVSKIFMDVKWEDGVQWQTVTQDDGEKWYTATVFYNFDFQVGADDHFVNNPGSKAQFTVRNNGTDQAPDWKLVEFRDLDQDL
jgi:hypothetical protein